MSPTSYRTAPPRVTVNIILNYTIYECQARFRNPLISTRKGCKKPLNRQQQDHPFQGLRSFSSGPEEKIS
jgi:hypothetical protein